MNVLSIEPLQLAKKMRELADGPTDLNRSRHFADRVRGRLLYSHASRAWLHYDGARWQFDTTGRAMRLAKETVREWQRLAVEESDDEARRKQLRFCASAQARARIEAMVFLAQSDLPAPEAFDVDPFTLNLQNGTLDLRSGELRPHSPGDYLTKLAPVDFDTTASCPRWERFASEIMQGDADLIAYLQRAFGLSLSGDVRDHSLWIFFGGGSNGKSTFLRTVKGLLGDYALTIDPAVFLSQKERSGPTPELARLEGVRFVAANELPEGGRLSENTVKALTGGDNVAARRLFSDVVEFPPTWKIAIATNHKPTIRDNSEGLWRRLELIPFDARFEGEQRVPDLGDQLKAEYAGILQWALRGFQEWNRKGGIGKARRIAEATSRYRADSDVVTAFLADRCIVRDGVRATSAQLYAEYTSWCEAGGEKKATKRAFLTQLRERNFADRKSDGATIFDGIGLLCTQ